MPGAIPHSCYHCQTRFLIDCKDNEPNTGTPWRICPPGNKLTLKDLEELSDTGCSFAKYLFAHIAPDDNDAVIARYSPHSYEEYTNSLLVGIPKGNQRYAYLNCMANEDSLVAHEVTQRPPNLKVASEESFDLARKWMRNCLESHHACPKPLGIFMPTRVLEFSDVDSMIYIRENLAHAPYAVLSYCWGGPQRVRLDRVKVTLGTWAITHNTLPQTLQDAIRVTRELGLRYLWVDSLCIIQDDAEDKAIEIGRMADIYQNSSVAIMASRAKGVDEGFLNPRFPFGPTESSMGFQLPYRSEDGKIGSVIAVEEDASVAYIDPLRMRGWAFQEFILSPRILDYGQMATSWICHNPEHATDGFSSPPNATWGRLRFQESLLGTGISTNEKSGKTCEERRDYLNRVWTVIVQNYMTGSLTYLHDRLPALAGIAERMSVQLGDEYLAGGWRKDLWHSLVWWNGQGRGWRRTPGYFAPSWSWACIPDGNIGFISTNHSFQDEGFQVLDCKIELVSQFAKFGSVKSGILTLSGRTFSARYVPDWSFTGPDNSSLLVDGLDGHGVTASSNSIIPDAVREDYGEGEIPLYLLCVCWDYKRNKISGMALRHLTDGTYARWGLFSIFLRLADGPNPAPPVHLEAHEAKYSDRYARWRASIPKKTMCIV